MRQAAGQVDPDQPVRTVTLPASWDDSAAHALAALVPGEGPASLAAASSVWLALVAARARQAGQDEAIAKALQELLLRRQAAPNAAVWRGEMAAPGYCVNVAGFHSPGAGFDVAGFSEAAGLAAQACRLLAPASPGYEIGLSGLDDLVACLGHPYDSDPARMVGACLAALLRGRVDQVMEGDQRDLLACGAAWPAPPRRCAVPGLAEAAWAAREAVARVVGGVAATGVFPPGAPDALLGVETGGVAPAFSPVSAMRLTRAAQDRLAAAALSPESALAAVLVGDMPLERAGVQAHVAMHQAIAPYLDVMPELPAALPRPPEPGPAAQRAPGMEALPARHAGLSQKATVGGHRVFLRTAEYADGRLGEITLNLPRESPAVRGLAECFAQAVSLGLQHGVALGDFVEAFTLTRFGPSGAVEGDPDVERATSVLDYVFRTLSATYLGERLPAPEMAEEAVQSEAEACPLLPLDLPVRRGQRRALRLVA